MYVLALAGVAQWTECQPVNQRVTSSIHSQDTGLGCGPGPQLGAERCFCLTTMFLYLSFSISSPLSE